MEQQGWTPVSDQSGWTPVAPPPGPPAGERTRVDTNAIGIDHQKVMQAVADAASKLPAPIRKYVAQQGGFAADVASSLVEMMSAPETVATTALSALHGALPTAPSTKPPIVVPPEPPPPRLPSLSKTRAVATDLATDPDVVGIAFPRTANAMRAAQKGKLLYDKAKEAAARANAAPPISPAETSVASGTPAPPDPQAPAAPAGSQSPAPFYPQKTLNELAIAARRAKVSLSDEDYTKAIEAVKQGATPEEAVAGLKPSGPPKVKLSAEETKAYVGLRNAGKSGQEAMDAIQQMRILREKFGLTTPTAEETRFPKGMRDYGSKNPTKPLP